CGGEVVRGRPGKPLQSRLVGFCDIDLNRLFFFQAEDGIRDSSVTGVQTCALPISQHRVLRRAVGGAALDAVLAGERSDVDNGAKIGRASCRESVDLGGRGDIKKQKRKHRRTLKTEAE